jgi:hypothetical protein
MIKLFVALAALTVLATAIPAQARTCTTTCTGYGNTQTCTTTCY